MTLTRTSAASVACTARAVTMAAPAPMTMPVAGPSSRSPNSAKPSLYQPQAGSSSLRGDVHMFGTTPGSLRDLVVDSMFDHPTPTATAHIALLGPSSSSLRDEPGHFGHFSDRLEADFCTNYACCGMQLTDMHGLLEHFESNHLNGSTSGANEQLTAITDAAVTDLDGLTSDEEGREQQLAAMKRRALQDFAKSVRDNERRGPSDPSRPANAGSGLRMSGFAGGPRETVVSPLTNPLAFDDMDSDVDTMDLGDDDAGTGDDMAGPSGYGSNSDAESIQSSRSFAAALENLRLRRPSRHTSPSSPDRSTSLGSAAAEQPAVVGSGMGTITPSQLSASGTNLAAMGDARTAPGALAAGNASGTDSDGAPANLAELLQRTGLPANFTPPPPSLPSGRSWVAPKDKPFKCPVPGCSKSYKQANGLKYHRLHGRCDARLVSTSDDSTATPTEGRETLEMKPYGCYVGPSCGKRYKNMNGLRYVRRPTYSIALIPQHYMHSGPHGEIGIQMLNLGTHPPPLFPPGHTSRSSSAHSSRQSSRAPSPAPAAPSFPSLPLGIIGT